MSRTYGNEAGATRDERDEVELEKDLAVLADQARDAVVQFVHERPHAALGVAAAAAFILGGGLTPRRLVRLGLSVGGPSLTRQLASQALRFATDTWSAYERPAGSHREPQ